MGCPTRYNELQKLTKKRLVEILANLIDWVNYESGEYFNYFSDAKDLRSEFVYRMDLTDKEINLLDLGDDFIEYGSEQYCQGSDDFLDNYDEDLDKED